MGHVATDSAQKHRLHIGSMEACGTVFSRSACAALRHVGFGFGSRAAHEFVGTGRDLGDPDQASR